MIGVYVLCNVASLNIYEIDYTEDKVLVGLNDQEPEWCPIDYTYNGFRWGHMNISFEECERI